MKNDPHDQEKALLLIMITTYWIVLFIICWFSFDSVVQFASYVLSRMDTVTLPDGHQLLPEK